MIRCITLNDDQSIEQLSQKLSTAIKHHWTHADINLYFNDKYWKYENTREVIYKISNPSNLCVNEFIKIFKITWEHSESIVFDVDKKQEVEYTRAIWNKNCHPDETFVIPEVEWVHIYTWRG